MQDPIASPEVKVLQTSAPQLPARQPKSSPKQHRPAAEHSAASRTKNKSPKRRPTPHVELAERLRRLRQLTRETAQAYLLKIDADLGALIKRLENVDRKFLQAELAELDIQAGWDDQKKNCLDTTRSLVNQIP